MFAKTKSGAEASAKAAKEKKEALEMTVGASPRRIKDMAKRIKPFVEKARLEGLPSDQEGLDFVASLFGFESYLAACAMAPSFTMDVGLLRSKSGSIFNKKKDPWLISSQEMLGGALVLGSTGAGKSEALIALAISALEKAPALGLLLMDGKGDWAQYPRWLAHMRSFEREHDLRVLDLMGVGGWWDAHETGVKKPRPTHRFDPIFGMGASSIAKWLSRALGARMLGVAPAKDLAAPEDAFDLMEAMSIVWAQDALDIMRDPVQEPGVSALVAAAALPQREVAGESGSAKAWRARLRLLLEEPSARMAFAAMKARALEPLSRMLDSYAGAFRCAKDSDGAWLEPEMRPNAPLSGQVCLVMLPALEKSTDELADLGRLVACSFQDAMEREESSAHLRSIAILDEFGYYGPDASELAAAARSAGVGLVLAAQDLWACQLGSWRDGLDSKVMSALSSLRVKIFMKSEDPSNPYLSFVHGSSTGSFKPDILDLKDQREGDAWVTGVGQGGWARIDYKGGIKRPTDLALKPVKCARRSDGR